MSEKQDEILAHITNLVGLNIEAQNKTAEALREQNKAIVHIPSRKDLVNVNLIVLILVMVAVGIGSYFNYSTLIDNRNIGSTNHQTVAIYCAASPNLPECTTPGSDTAKAGAILANCRLFANLIAVSPTPEKAKDLPTYAGCLALGF